MITPYYPWDKQAYIYTSPYPFNSIFGLYPLYFIPTVNEISDTIERLKKIRPDILVCYPSHLREISKSISAGDLKMIRLKAISVNSEMSTQKERDDLAAVFGCGVYDEYSSEELTRIASQCPRHNYHIFEDINYLEVLDENGSIAPEGRIGEIVGTNLHNFSMPMIRYRQADLGSISGAQCACGRNFRILKELKGRQNDRFILPSGRVLSSGFLLDASYDLVLEFTAAIKDFCIIQEEPDKITIEVLPGAAFGPTIADKIKERFRSLLQEDVGVAVKAVANLYKTRTGKLNPIISLVGRGRTRS
jgi:phenylacetate-CoA ligase